MRYTVSDTKFEWTNIEIVGMDVTFYARRITSDTMRVWFKSPLLSFVVDDHVLKVTRDTRKSNGIPMTLVLSEGDDKVLAGLASLLVSNQLTGYTETASCIFNELLKFLDDHYNGSVA